MAIPLFNSGALKVSVKHLWQKRRGGLFYYRRRYPKEVREAHHQQGIQLPVYKVVSLKTNDLATAAKRAISLTTRDDEDWWKLKNGFTEFISAGKTPKDKAERLLRKHGLEAVPFDRQSAPDADLLLDYFIDTLDQKRPTPDPEEPYSHIHPALDSYLEPHEATAVQILKGEYKFHLSDAKEHYLKQRTVDGKTLNTVNASFRLVTGALGNKPIEAYRRREISQVIDDARKSGLKTATIKRQLGTVRAAVNELIRDEELDIKNPFVDFKIKGLGEDAQKRASLNMEQLERLRSYVRATDTTTADILGMLVDTGARVSEIAGLMREDVKLDVEVPYVFIRKNSLRPLKTKESQRRVPLVGDALFAAKRALKKTNSIYLFPRYMSDNGYKGDAASAALRVATRKLKCLTPHSLRHTMRTRLRNANVPEPLANEIGGWARISVSQYYGKQTALELMKEVLERSLTVELD